MTRARAPIRPGGQLRFRRALGNGETWRDAFANRPPWADALLVRRLLAAVFAMAAVALLLRGDPDDARAAVVVASRDLPPGHLLESADLRIAHHPSALLPEGAVHDAAPLSGAVLTAALRAGEVVTDLRVVGPRLATIAAGTENARIVPIRLADNAITDVLRAGDRVDVVAVEESDAAPARTLATDATVVLVSGSPTEPGPGRATERVMLVALDSARATAVAAASLSTALTVVLH
ncbi:SAF domain-containing protein [Nocardia brevicatena]|uniref:SAF domain-containing protein n=1 Tax=Nocardia brevicatena TaxID=37327 RepID=UPI0002F5AC05|nr:SAF domain-containing protein [Nocardia brevicatena]